MNRDIKHDLTVNPLGAHMTKKKSKYPTMQEGGCVNHIVSDGGKDVRTAEGIIYIPNAWT